MAGLNYRWVVRVWSLDSVGLVTGWLLAELVVVGRCGSGCWVVAGLAGRRWVVVRRYSSLRCTVGVGYGRGGCTIVVVVPIVIVSAAVVVAVFVLAATCRFKDTGWVLFV